MHLIWTQANPKTPTFSLLCKHIYLLCLLSLLVCCFAFHHLFTKSNALHSHFTHCYIRTFTHSFHFLPIPSLLEHLITQTTKGLRSPSILVGTTTPLHNLLTPYFDGSSNGADAGDLGLIVDFLVVVVETLAFFCFCLHVSLLCLFILWYFIAQFDNHLVYFHLVSCIKCVFELMNIEFVLSLV